MRFLDSERNEGRSLEEIAKEIVEGFHEALSRDLKKPATPLRQGMLLKSPLTAKVWRVAWLEGEDVWLVTEQSAYGTLGFTRSQLWDKCEEFFPKRRIQVDGKGKMVEMSEEDIEEAWANPDWEVGDKLSQHQGQYHYLVIATGPNCVLMRNSYGDLVSDSNANLAKFYRRETEVKEIEW
jgi:hypothetical protein